MVEDEVAEMVLIRSMAETIITTTAETGTVTGTTTEMTTQIWQTWT